MNIKELNPATIGHLRKMDELGFSNLDANDIYTTLQYIILYSLPISDVKTLTKDKMQELADDLSYDVTPSDIEDIVHIIDNHIKATHINDFEAVNPHQKSEKKTPQTH